MANQTAILRGVGDSGKQWEQPVLVVDTTATAVQFPNYGTQTTWSVPERITFFDMVLPANTATVVRLNPQVNGDTKANKALLTAFLSNATTVAGTRFGQPFVVDVGANLGFIST